MLSTFNRFHVIACLLCYSVFLLQLEIAYVHAEDHDHEAIITTQDGQEHLVFHHSPKLVDFHNHDDHLGIVVSSHLTPPDHEIHFPSTHIQRSTAPLEVNYASQPTQFVIQHIGPILFSKNGSALSPSPPILCLRTTVLLI